MLKHVLYYNQDKERKILNTRKVGYYDELESIGIKKIYKKI